MPLEKAGGINQTSVELFLLAGKNRNPTESRWSLVVFYGEELTRCDSVDLELLVNILLLLLDVCWTIDRHGCVSSRYTRKGVGR